MTYTRDQVCTDNYFDCYDLDTLPKEYLKITAQTSLLTIGDKEFEPITLHNWLDYEPGNDTHDLATIQLLMTKYSQGIKVSPLIVDTHFYVIDGRHRLAALNTLGIETVEVYYPA